MAENNEEQFEKMDDEFPFDNEEEETLSTRPIRREPGDRSRPTSRNFWLVAGVLAAVFIVIVIILTVLAFWVLPRNQQARLEEAALINAHNTATARSATDFAIAQAQIETATTAPTDTIEPTNTPIVLLATETSQTSPTQEAGTGAQLDDPARTATVAALLTQAAAGTITTEGTAITGQQGGATPGVTSTALPQSGLAEDIGLPGMFGIALALVFVIFLVRRVRLSN